MAEMMGYAMDQLRKEGVPEANLRAGAAILVGQAYMESKLDPNIRHDKVNGVYTGYGIYGAHLGRMTKMLSWLKNNGYAPNSAEGQMRQMAHSAMTEYPAMNKLLTGATEQSLGIGSRVATHVFEGPLVENNRSGATLGAYKAGAPDLRPAIIKQTQGPKASITPETSSPGISIPSPASPSSSINSPVSMNTSVTNQAFSPISSPQAQLATVAQIPESNIPPAPTRRPIQGEATESTENKSSVIRPQIASIRSSSYAQPYARIDNLGMMFISAEAFG